MVPRETLIHWREYWNGNRNDSAMWDALNHIMEELDTALSADYSQEALDGCTAAELREANVALAQESHRRATLLHEWLDTELDSQDEEYQSWLDSFTERVKTELLPTIMAQEAPAAPQIIPKHIAAHDFIKADGRNECAVCGDDWLDTRHRKSIQPTIPCKGKNCGRTDGTHSAECYAEHEATVNPGGKYDKPAPYATPETDALCDEWERIIKCSSDAELIASVPAMVRKFATTCERLEHQRNALRAAIGEE